MKALQLIVNFRLHSIFGVANKFAGPCAQGVLDPLMIPGTVSRSGSFLLFLEHPWGHWIQSRFVLATCSAQMRHFGYFFNQI